MHMISLFRAWKFTYGMCVEKSWGTKFFILYFVNKSSEAQCGKIICTKMKLINKKYIDVWKPKYLNPIIDSYYG